MENPELEVVALYLVPRRKGRGGVEAAMVTDQVPVVGLRKQDESAGEGAKRAQDVLDYPSRTRQ